jgi:ATP-dependent RNA helicase DeaD
METFRVEVGLAHGVKPANLVGAIANEAGLDSQHIGRIKILDDYSTVDLPAGLPKALLDTLKKVWVAGRPLDISRMGAGAKTLPVRVAVRPARITLPKDGKPAAPGKPRPAAVRKKPSKPS